ncbi:peptidoglycan-binding protein [Streptomyces sp. NPDC048643]|uniref:N-acetylmuramoyl-L-alanine amidase n=1 Tax=Streptomyces sp. NPDC048643 TaxID=3155637 RepID=UPI0034211679
MAKFAGATWRPIPVNYTKGGQDSVHGVVVHIMAGTLAGTDSWFRNSAAQASSHFGTGKAGALYQWVDTADRAWAQADGNRTWLSVENEGKGGDTLTDAQLDRNAEVLAWAHKTYGVPLQVASGVSGKGLGYHGMGGASWGNHPSCPGPKIVAQLPEIVKRAKAIAGVKPAAPAKPSYEPFPGASWFKTGRKSPIVLAMRKRLIAVGCNKYKSSTDPDTIGSGDIASYETWQRKCGFTGASAEWPPGKTTWDKLKVPNV